MRVLSSARAVGGSIMVTIPKEVVSLAGIREGQLLEIEVSKPKRNFFGIARGISRMTKGDEMGARE